MPLRSQCARFDQFCILKKGPKTEFHLLDGPLYWTCMIIKLSCSLAKTTHGLRFLAQSRLASSWKDVGRMQMETPPKSHGTQERENKPQAKTL